jgi:serine/threonine-protein kinase RsbW
MRSAHIPEAVTRSFPARVEEVTTIVAYLAGRAAELGVPDMRVMQLELAVEEAVMNICSYAYPAEAPGELLVRTWAGPDCFTVEIEDTGDPFDPLARADPDLPDDLDARVVGGLGIMLIRRLVDDVRYRREGGRNVFTMVVRIEE